jgi:hypothetical protein
MCITVWRRWVAFGEAKPRVSTDESAKKLRESAANPIETLATRNFVRGGVDAPHS